MGWRQNAFYAKTKESKRVFELQLVKLGIDIAEAK